MAFVVLTFVAVLAIIIGAYWLLVVRPEEQETAQLRRRIGTAKKNTSAVKGLLRETERLSNLRGLNTVLARTTVFSTRLQKTISQSGLRLTVGTLLLSSGCVAGVVYLLVTRITGIALAGLIAGAAASTFPYLFVRRARTKRLLKFEEQFPEAIDLLSRALRAGHALTTGLQMVGDELQDPIRAEFRLLYDQQNFGLPLSEALRNFAERIPSLDARFFVTAVLTQREAGGNLSEVLDNLAAIIRDRFRVKRQVRVISAHGRMTGYVLSGLPPALAVILMFLMPENYGNFLRDPLGLRMLLVALAMQIIGTLIIRKIVKIEY